ncbi:GntR family transcriptional regulator [Aestuariicoccus sp. MJ-SS9]|uniref:GntR family transcriptional regulator n=1 Tax=Aestuariicoccus sp. MJ-SS9 TaxID=3079855 RepID=UPI00290ED5C9|nr:GntR family transcriptional regulator [Aestuariicoccus sp. MJ-SS9]MDU8910312.1 GntR family transcriptional regulator [Aestuariicoccus sp. MJ-SS9]
MTGPGTRVDQAVARLREMIFSGDLAPGSDHLETELAARLGMSRTPLREAALILEAQGLVAVRPRRGVRIQPLLPGDMREIYEILTELESLAAARAAEARQPEAELAGMTAAIDDMDLALATGDLTSWAEADDRFHAELVRLSGSRRIAGIVGMLADQVRRARRLTLHMRPLPTASNDDHRRVLAAIRAGRPDEARRLHRAHRQAAGEMLVGLLEKHHLRQV